MYRLEYKWLQVFVTYGCWEAREVGRQVFMIIKKLFWIVCLKVKSKLFPCCSPRQSEQVRLPSVRALGWEWKTSVSTASSKEDSGAIWLKKREENEDFSPQRTFQTIQNSFLYSFIKIKGFCVVLQYESCDCGCRGGGVFLRHWVETEDVFRFGGGVRGGDEGFG